MIFLGICTPQRVALEKPGFDRKNRRERSRGRRRTLWMNRLQEWLGERSADRADHQGGDLFHATKGQRVARSMIALRPQEYGTLWRCHTLTI